MLIIHHRKEKCGNILKFSKGVFPQKLGRGGQGGRRLVERVQEAGEERAGGRSLHGARNHVDESLKKI